jgi:glycosyltransferase involved in cell wall biosynthesis
VAAHSYRPLGISRDTFTCVIVTGMVDVRTMHVALVLSGLAGGGAQRRMLTLAGAFVERGHRVSLLPVRDDGPFRKQVPAGVDIISVGGRLLSRTLPRWNRSAAVLVATFALMRRLRDLHPDAVLSTSDPANVAVLAARRLGRLPVASIAVVNIDHTTSLARKPAALRKLYRCVLRSTYRSADAVVGISAGTSRSTAAMAGLPAERVITILNPVDAEAIDEKARAPGRHRWLEDRRVPVVLAVGKLKPQKDYPTLIRAFARARSQRPLRLLVLGEGELRATLETLVCDLGESDHVVFEGFVDNPFCYMARASVLVLSSAWEGLSNVLLEALACGCPVISTDCPSGPREILENGSYGELVPVGDEAALARAILDVIDRPRQSERLRARARRFSVDAAAEAYLSVIEAAVAARRSEPRP